MEGTVDPQSRSNSYKVLKSMKKAVNSNRYLESYEKKRIDSLREMSRLFFTNYSLT